MSMDIKVIKAELFKVIQSGRKLAGAWMKIGIPFPENVLATLATMAQVSVIDGAIQRKYVGQKLSKLLYFQLRNKV